MTATVAESEQVHEAGGVGRISRIIGPVVDVEFPADEMPEQYNLLFTEVDLTGQGEGEGKKRINLEVAQHIGDSMVR
ncbi:MAG: F0F1 ATP synthase subunit beta, partial [Dermatophilaceae bacterium]